MRVLVDARHLSDPQRTGVGEYTAQLLRALFAIEGDDTYELVSTGRRMPRLSLGDVGRGLASATHFPVPNKLLKLTTLAANWPRLDRLATTPPDLVFLPNLNFTALSPGLPYALTIHDLSWKIFPQFFSWKMRAWHRGTRPDRLVAGAAAILVPSHATKEDVVRFFGKPKAQVHVVPHGADPTFQPEPRAQDHGVRSRHRLPKRFALHVGTLEPRKNILAIVDAMEEYRERTGDDLALVLAGGWGWKSGEIRRRIAGKPWIRHLGYVPSEDRPALYRAAAVLAWPSIYEGFGLPVLEAMASGTPVVTSHTSSLPELTGDAAVLVDPFNARDLTDALEQLLGSLELQARLRRAGIERAKAFSWEKAAKETRTIFKNCP